MALNKYQSKHENRGVTLKAYLESDESKGVYSEYGPFCRGYSSFVANMILFEQEAKNKEKISEGVVTKTDSKNSIANRLGTYLGLTNDYAVQIKNGGLAKMVNYSEYEILQMKDSDILPFVTGLKKNVFTTTLLGDVKFITYKVTDLLISALVADATSFNKNIGTIKEDSNFSSSANDNMNMIINNMDLDIESMDKTIQFFATDFPEFINGYEKNKALIKTGVRHEGLLGCVTKAGIPQESAEVIIDGKKVLTDVAGNYEKYHKNGKVSVTVKTLEGDTMTKEAEIIWRKMTTLNFDL